MADTGTRGAPASADWYHPSPLETAAGWVYGYASPVGKTLSEGPRESPLDALRGMLLPALSRPPCTVSFSGGRDSSAVLAAAAHIAREEGLPPPLPLTQVYPGIPEADETAWQELVIRHLGLEEWLKIEITDELDVLGPRSTNSLRELGVLWPGTVHTKGFVLERVPGRTLLTGEGGDEVFGRHRIAPVTRLLGGQRPGARSIRQLMGAFAPPPIRKRILEREARRDAWPWLRPQAVDAHVDAIVAESMARLWRWDRAVRQTIVTRSWQMGRRNLVGLARRQGVDLRSPLLEPRFVDSIARQGGWRGYPTRTAAMARVFGSFLPLALLDRRSKASFNRVYFGRSSSAFIAEWDGRGLDESLVDPELVHQALAGAMPHGGALLLLHAAWLSSAAR